MATYVYDAALGYSVDKTTRAPMVDRNAPLALPAVASDYAGYQSPIDGSWIEGRRARRYDMEKNDCVDGNDVQSLGGKLKNERFAKKWGAEERLDG